MISPGIELLERLSQTTRPLTGGYLLSLILTLLSLTLQCHQRQTI